MSYFVIKRFLNVLWGLVTHLDVDIGHEKKVILNMWEEEKTYFEQVYN